MCFQKVFFRDGFSQTSELNLKIFFIKNNLDYTRTGFLASKKVGNSVKRNRARRLMKESLRLTSLKLPKGYDFIFIARNTIVDANCRQVQKSLESALKRTGVLER